MPTRDDDFQSLDPREYPDPDVEKGAAVLPCPHCLAVLHENAPRCPRCGEYLVSDDFDRKPLWLVVGVLICLGLLFLGLRFGF
ncbi:MAG: hypothetical protein U0793_04215 [Gemmataceae bacterium]